MHEIEQKIISVLKDKNQELSTSQILELIDKDYGKLRKKIDSVIAEEKRDLKRELAKMHRKTLYHINQLVKNNILRLAKHGDKGEKFFCFNLGDDEELVISPGYKKRIVISRPVMPVMPIEGYEQKGIITKYETATWIDRANSLIIMCKKIKKLENLNKILTESVFSVINDCVCLENFENMINNFEVVDFLKKLDEACEDYGKKVSCIINLIDIDKKKFYEILAKCDLKNIFFIFNLNSNELQERFELFSNIISIYSKRKKLLYVKNRNLCKAPHFIGRAGPYSILDKEWGEQEHLCVVCSQSSLIVDVNKFFLEYGLDVKKFTQLMLNISKSILSANSLQRRKSEDYFKELVDVNQNVDFLEISRNYIRFWNYGLSQEGIDPELVLNMISEAKKKIDNFARAEETIYMSCGMAMRFKLALSCASKESAELSPAKYEPLEICGLEDLYKEKIKKEIIAREIVSQIFDGGNEITFHRLGDFDVDDIIREISVILNTYKLPVFNFDFSEIKGDLKLTSFLR